MRRLTTPFAVLAMVLCWGASAPAQSAHPDFTGTWTLETSKSQAPMIPQSSQLVVSQSDKVLTIDRTAKFSAGTQTGKLVYSIDGSSSTNTANPPGGAPIEFKSTTSWDGPTLVITTSADFNGGYKQVERWTLSEGGKQLTVNGDIAVSGQTATAKMVYTKKS